MNLKERADIGAVVHMHDEVEGAELAATSAMRFLGRDRIILAGNLEEPLMQVSARLSLPSVRTPLYVDNLRSYWGSRQNGDSGHDVALIEAIVLEQLRSMKEMATSLPTEYLLLLHADHRVLRAIPPCALRMDYEFDTPNRFDSSLVSAYIDVFPGAKVPKGWGIPGYLRRDALLQVLAILCDTSSDAILRRLLERDARFVFDDLLLASLFTALGFRTGHQGFTREKARSRRRWLLSHPYLLHQVR